MALVGMSAKSKDLSDGERAQAVAAIVRDSAHVIRRRTDAQGFAYEIGANATTARG
jgi:hypothetical protein